MRQLSYKTIRKPGNGEYPRETAHSNISIFPLSAIAAEI